MPQKSWFFVIFVANSVLGRETRPLMRPGKKWIMRTIELNGAEAKKERRDDEDIDVR